MANASIQVRLSPELKQQAEELFAELGLSVSDAVRLFLKQSVNRGGLPLQPQTGQSNAETVAALEELKHKQTLQRYGSFRDIRTEVVTGC
jgi:DNA-damage-inducible protein J